MLKRSLWILFGGALVFLAGYHSGAQTTAKAASNRVYELRTYTTLPGRLDALNSRFRNHTTRIFEKHGMRNVGYWVPADGEKKNNTLVYVLSYESRDAAKQAWAAFRTDPEWKKAQAESEKDGKIVEKVESVYMDPVDYSALK
jgi:hypothetical protein